MNQRRLSAPPTRVFSVAWEQRAPLDIGDCGSVVPQLRYRLTLPRGLERGWHLSLQRPLGTQDQAVALAGEAGSRAGGAQSPSHLLSGGGGAPDSHRPRRRATRARQADDQCPPLYLPADSCHGPGRFHSPTPPCAARWDGPSGNGPPGAAELGRGVCFQWRFARRVPPR